MVPFSFAKEGELEGLMKELEHLPRQMSHGIIESTEYPKSRTEGFLPFIKANLSSIHEKDFRKLWNLSQPLVVTSCLDNFKISWTPEYFIDNYGKEQCFLVDCDTEQYVKSTVGKFFEEFSMSDAKRPLKLKVCSPWSLLTQDWPPADDFAEKFPSLFNDFENALPFPRYTRRKGFMNLAARFPEDLVVPDLGPKMYIAHASEDGLNGKGTTRLHLDITDAVSFVVKFLTKVNIMTFAAPSERATARGGAAVWDIFPTHATDILRAYLKEVASSSVDDPVLRQTFFISTPQLAELQEKYSITPWRIYQNPGDAVFIPAGCAHQVSIRKKSLT
jgi:[histone H3]-dimethyl-L-lysine9 demethylase